MAAHYEFLYALRRDLGWNIAAEEHNYNITTVFLYALRRDLVWNLHHQAMLCRRAHYAVSIRPSRDLVWNPAYSRRCFAHRRSSFYTPFGVTSFRTPQRSHSSGPLRGVVSIRLTALPSFRTLPCLAGSWPAWMRSVAQVTRRGTRRRPSSRFRLVFALVEPREGDGLGSWSQTTVQHGSLVTMAWP